MGQGGWTTPTKLFSVVLSVVCCCIGAAICSPKTAQQGAIAAFEMLGFQITTAYLVDEFVPSDTPAMPLCVISGGFNCPEYFGMLWAALGSSVLIYFETINTGKKPKQG